MWSGYGDNRQGSSTARRLNSDQFRKIRRLKGSKNFRSERSLYSIRSLTFNQWRNLFTGVMCENLVDLTTVRAREFWIVEGDLFENLVD